MCALERVSNLGSKFLLGSKKVKKMAVFTEQQRQLTRRLISAMTDFTPPEENFKLCFRFCKSNFQYHRFLSVDAMKVQRSITGLVEKFQVHSQHCGA